MDRQKDRQTDIQLSLSPGMLGLVGSKQQGGDVREGGVAPLQTGLPSVFIIHPLYIQSTRCKRLLNLQTQTHTHKSVTRNAINDSLSPNGRKFNRGRTVISDWPHDCVHLWPSGRAAPPQDHSYYHDLECRYLENRWKTTDWQNKMSKEQHPSLSDISENSSTLDERLCLKLSSEWNVNMQGFWL